MGFLDIHLPIEPSPKTVEKEAFEEALRASEVAILRRRIERATTEAREMWFRQMPQLIADARRVILERGGDPSDDGLGDD